MSRNIQSRAVVTSARRPGRFINEVVLELKKVKWPSKQDVTNMTIVVLALLAIVLAYVAVLDFVFGRLFRAMGMY